jgi:circadian clock protein KaiC
MIMSTPTAKDPVLSTSGPGRIEKVPTGILGLDEITFGGLPRGRTTLVCGGPGCGKTLLALEFLVRGATQYGEPGVFVAFEETAGELATNAASLGFDLAALEADGKLVVDFVRIERSEIEEAGEYDLEGLFIRLGFAIDSIGAKRVAIDTLEILFAGLPNPGILRAELRRLFRWLKEKGLTVIVTAERGDHGLTRHGLEEYISDCVIALDNRVSDQISTRLLRVLKYRGSAHDSDEVPFLIDDVGLSVLPVSSLGLDHQVATSRVSTGVPDLDAMLGGGGFFRGSTVLVSGGAGSGKSSLAASFAQRACRDGKRCLFFIFEESSNQVLRNMRSIGIDLAPLMEQDLLRFHASRPSAAGLEMHLARTHRLVSEFEPEIVILDPITNLVTVGTTNSVRSMLTRMIDFFKSRQITALMTSLAGAALPSLETSNAQISSLVDTWLLLRELEADGERNRGLHVLKSRGMAHSNQVREFRLTDQGIELIDVYLGTDGILVGAAREARMIRDEARAREREYEAQQRQRRMVQRRAAIRAQIDALNAELEADEEDLRRVIEQERLGESGSARDEARMLNARRVDLSLADGNRGRTVQP